MASLDPILGLTIAGDNDPADELPIYNNFQLLLAALGISSLTQAQINALTVAQAFTGRVVYNTTTNLVQVCVAGSWFSLAGLFSPAFTGAPTAPTPTAGDNSTKIATTAFLVAALALYAPLASPALTGTPTAPTPPAGDNSTRLATTAFAQALAFSVGAYAQISGYTSGTNRTPSTTAPTLVVATVNPASTTVTVTVGGVTIASYNSGNPLQTLTFICPPNTAYSITYTSSGLSRLMESTL